MHGIYTYYIKIKGSMDEAAFNAMSPLQITVVRTDGATTQFIVCTDQSGLIGVLRHLRHQGFVLLSIYRE